jgi:hypothetical protein
MRIGTQLPHSLRQPPETSPLIRGCLLLIRLSQWRDIWVQPLSLRRRCSLIPAQG